MFHEISDFDYDIIALAEKLSDDPTSTDEFVLRLDSTNVECFGMLYQCIKSEQPNL